MTGRDYQMIVFKRLTEVDPEAVMRLMNDPRVRRHLPLARGHFGPAECEKFMATKERMWKENGYGPWAFFLNEEFIGWGGLQPEGDDADVGMVLDPSCWGAARALYPRIVDHAFEELGVDSVIMLLPPTRTRVAGILRLGFRRDGEGIVDGERFIRYRLTASSVKAKDDRR